MLKLHLLSYDLMYLRPWTWSLIVERLLLLSISLHM